MPCRAGGFWCRPCCGAVWSRHRRQAAAGSGWWLCPASPWCLAVPREEEGCACGFWLCGTSCCGAVWGCPGSAPGQGPGCRGSGTGIGAGIQLCPTILGAITAKGAGRRCRARAAPGRLLPTASATTQRVLPLLWLLVADRPGTILSCSPSRGASGCSGPFVASFIGYGAWAWLSCVWCLALGRVQAGIRVCAVPGSVMFIRMCSALRGSPLLLRGGARVARGRCWARPGPGWAQPALGPGIVWWLVPETPLTEQRGCSNLCLLLCSSGQKCAFFGLSPELSRCHFSLPSPSSAGSAGQSVPTARASREGRVAPAWEGDGRLLWLRWGCAGHPD